MKKLFIIIIVLATIFTGCRYKEGPLISFRSVEGRLNGYWQVVGLTSDGMDSLQYYNDSCGSKMWIHSNNNPDGTPNGDPFINFYNGKNKFGGNFTFSDNKNNMNVWFAIPIPPFNGIGPLGGGKKSEWKILKLTMQEFKISTDFNGKNYNISYKKSTQ